MERDFGTVSSAFDFFDILWEVLPDAGQGGLIDSATCVRLIQGQVCVIQRTGNLEKAFDNAAKGATLRRQNKFNLDRLSQCNGRNPLSSY